MLVGASNVWTWINMAKLGKVAVSKLMSMPASHWLTHSLLWSAGKARQLAAGVGFLAAAALQLQ